MALSDDEKVMRNSTGQAIEQRLREIRNALMPRAGGTIYGFHIDSSESDGAAAMTYLADAVGMTPAAMNYTSSLFNWGSWRDAFFIPRPCMLKYDGTVDYYLDPNDYSKKYDGVTASDIADPDYGGNAMMEWGQNGKIIWYKIVPDDNDPTSASVYIADYQADEDFVAWSFINNQGQMVDHFYTPIYNGSLDTAGRLRSLSGIAAGSICQSKNATAEFNAARLNNPGTDILWNTEVWCDNVLIILLLYLMGKSLDTQTVFGNGRINNSSNMIGTGTMNDKGLFWGGNGNNDGVKVFGMENFWGNQWRRFCGLVNVSGTSKYKMTRGTEDGSEAADYLVSTTGADYAGYKTGPALPAASGSYIRAETFNADCMIPTDVTGGSSTSYYYDALWTNNSQCDYAVRGGSSSSGASVGAACLALYFAASLASWALGAAPSCKPLS